MRINDDDEIYDFEGNRFEEIETDCWKFVIYYVRTAEDEHKLKLKIHLDDDNLNLWYYIIVILIIMGSTGMVITTILILYQMYCKSSSPFQSQEWKKKATERYNKILSESIEGIYNPIQEKYHETNCSICLVDFEKNTATRTLKCYHVFHKKCIEVWIHSKIDQIPRCPMCNTELTQERPPG